MMSGSASISTCPASKASILAQRLPVALWQVELAAKVEQGDLADLLTDALGGDEAIGEVCFVIGLIPGFCFADKHCRDMRLVPRGIKGSLIIL
jgi:hypothetical protein